MVHPIDRLVSIALLAACLPGQAAGQGPPAPRQDPQTQLIVTVTAEDSRRMRTATRAIQDHGDPFLAALAPDLMPLTSTMSALGRTFTLGPLTPLELAIVDLSSYLKAHEAANGPIRVQVRRNWTETEPIVYRFTEAGFLSMLAAIAKGPTMQVPDRQRGQIIWLGRT